MRTHGNLIVHRLSLPIGLALVAMTMILAQATAGWSKTPVSSERPTWVDDPAASYSPDDYLVGVGAGETTDEAVEDARADLAAAFRARVRSTTLVEDDVSETFSRDSNTFDRSTRSRSATEVKAEETLSNIAIGGTWHDKQAGRYRAIVFIKRLEAEQTISADIRSRLVSISQLLDCDGCYNDVIAEYGGAARAQERFREYEELSAQLRVVSEGRSGAVDAGLGARVAAWLADAGRQLTLRVLAAPAELTPSLRETLQLSGFVVVSGPALFTAEVEYATQATTDTSPFVFERWELSLRIRKAADGAEVITLNKQDRAGHKSRKAAQERCLRGARKALAGEFLDELIAFLTDG